MIIENAFLKLPELLVSNYDHADTYEATVVHLFSVALFMELNSRNIPRPFEHVYIEKPFPTVNKDDQKFRADMFVKLAGVVETHGRMKLYGVREQNWVEVKAFLGSTRDCSTPSKTENAGKVLRDLLRICVLPEELPGAIRQNGRYLLLVFSSEPSETLALKDNTQERTWLSGLLIEGDRNIKINLSDEPKSLREAVGSGFMDSDLQADVKIQVTKFIPEGTTPSPVFWGYLARIRSFTIEIYGAQVSYDDKPDTKWTHEQNNRLQAVRNVVLDKL